MAPDKKLIFATYDHELTLIQGYDTLARLKTDQVLELEIIKFIFSDPRKYQDFCLSRLGRNKLELDKLWLKTELDQVPTELTFKALSAITLYDNYGQDD